MAISIVFSILHSPLPMFAGTTDQVDTVLCNKHKRAKQQTLQSLQCHIAYCFLHQRLVRAPI